MDERIRVLREALNETSREVVARVAKELDWQSESELDENDSKANLYATLASVLWKNVEERD